MVMGKTFERDNNKESKIKNYELQYVIYDKEMDESSVKEFYKTIGKKLFAHLT